MREMNSCSLHHKFLVTSFVEKINDGHRTDKYVTGFCLDCKEFVQDCPIYGWDTVLCIKDCSNVEIEVFLISKILDLYNILRYRMKLDNKKIKYILDKIYNKKDEKDLAMYRRDLQSRDSYDIISEVIRKK